ncbi:hypothetical protein CTAYLR_002976 [Chrysophaeum taylorii]|uniref:Major facilitator superfamily (MFS) profile domain-containing protein n=1 Tax=Chrysophaeum taylorii TaxID=2483200 RepID=A0AAD7U6X5_9STRA|nr:hypothetical protein CTAYLR_002976 [Chrysophaeum taylorii]
MSTSSSYGSVSEEKEQEAPLKDEEAPPAKNGHEESNGHSRQSNNGHIGGGGSSGSSSSSDTVMSFFTVSYIVLLGDATRGLMFPTLWPLVSSLGGTKTKQGVIVAAFSMGRVVVSPFYGAISSYRGYRDVLIFAHLIVAMGAIWYTRVESLTGLLGAQICLGLGCGTLGVTRSYVAESVPKHQRTIYLGRLTAMQYAGFTTTPFLGSLMFHLGTYLETKILEGGWEGYVSIDALSFPATLIFFGAILACVLLMLPTFVELAPERRTKLQNRGTKIVNGHAPAASSLAAAAAISRGTRRREDMFAGVGLILNVITKGAIGCYETIGVMYATGTFGMAPPVVGYVVGACGFLGVAALLSFKIFAKYVDDVQLMTGGMAIMLLSCVLLIERLRPPFVSVHVSQVVWAIAVFLMYAIGYPVGHTAVIGWFSKAMGKRPQGFLMGLFASAGSVARVAFPIFTGVVAQRFDSDAVFFGLFLMLAITLAVIACFADSFRHAAY